MFCQKCGREIPYGAFVCPNCGAPSPVQSAGQQNFSAQTVYPQIDRPGEIKTYFPQAILLMIFCCLPFGIVSLVYSCRVNNFLVQQDYVQAKRASQMSKIWAWIALGSGFLFVDTLFWFIIEIAALYE